MIGFIKFAHRLSKISGVAATLLIIAAVFVTTEMVIVRYFLNMSTTWQTEFVIFSLAAATFIGSPYVLLKKKHVSIDIVTHYMSKKNQKLMSYLAAFFSIIFPAIFCNTFFLYKTIPSTAKSRVIRAKVINLKLLIHYISLLSANFHQTIFSSFNERPRIMNTA